MVNSTAKLDKSQKNKTRFTPDAPTYSVLETTPCEPSTWSPFPSYDSTKL